MNSTKFVKSDGQVCSYMGSGPWRVQCYQWVPENKLVEVAASFPGRSTDTSMTNRGLSGHFMEK